MAISMDTVKTLGTTRIVIRDLPPLPDVPPKGQEATSDRGLLAMRPEDQARRLKRHQRYLRSRGSPA
jgi:hypothetical protein